MMHIRRILSALSAVLLSVSFFVLPAAALSGWVDADTNYIDRPGQDHRPDAITIQLKYVFGAHTIQDDDFNDTQHYGANSWVIQLDANTPYSYPISEMYVDAWTYYEGGLETRSLDSPNVDPGWDGFQRRYNGVLDLMYNPDAPGGWLEYDIDLDLEWTSKPDMLSEDMKSFTIHGTALEETVNGKPFVVITPQYRQVHMYFQLLQLHYSDNPLPSATPVTIHTDADKDPGEKSFPIPAAVAAALLLGGAGIYLMNRNKYRKQKDREEDTEIPQFEMRIHKEFGDRIPAGEYRYVYAKIVARHRDGTETNEDEYTRQIRLYSNNYLQVKGRNMTGEYMGFAVYAPLSNEVPDTASLVFDLRGHFRVEMKFRIGGCIIVTDPATHAETVYHENEQGFWLSQDGRTLIDPTRIKEWMAQRKRDQEWIAKERVKIEEGQTAMDRELRKIRSEYEAEAKRIDEETKRTLYNLKHFGVLEGSPEYLKEIAARNVRIAEVEGAAAQRRAAVYHTMLYGATATKIATDKAFDIIGSKGGVAGKVGKALYTLAVDQAGAVTEALIEGKDVRKEMAKAGLGSLHSISKDYVESGPAKFVTIVGGSTAVSMGNAMIDGKSAEEVLHEGKLGNLRGTFEFSTELVGDNLKKLIGPSADGENNIIMDKDGNILQIVIDETDQMIDNFKGLAKASYQNAENNWDRRIAKGRSKK